MHSLGDIFPLLSLSTRAERAALRAERIMAAREKRYGRLAHLELDDGVALTPEMLEALTDCHHATYIAYQWSGLAERAEVATPEPSHKREQAARRQLLAYAPNWQERVFAEEAHRRRELTEQVMAAAHADATEHRHAVENAETQNAETLKARRILAFDRQTLQEAVAASGLATLRHSLNSVGLAWPAPERVVAVLDLIQEDDIPPERITSRNPRDARRELTPDEDRRRIHLAAACATALRAAGELVGLLPVETLEIVAECELPGATQTPILQFRISRQQVERMAWAGEPVTLLRSLGPRMNWATESGFRPIPLWRGELAKAC
jgi:hypothetical protein